MALLSNELQQANKYAFVQDFKKAEEILKSASKLYENEYEIFFRRVEIATKNETLDSLILDLAAHAKKASQSEAIKMAHLLAKIKKYFLLTKNTQPESVHSQLDAPFPSNDKVEKLTRKKMKIERHALISDDVVIANQSLVVHSLSHDAVYFDNILQQAFFYYEEHPLNYASCYLVGCAYYYLGNYNEAIIKWKQAVSLNPHSICVLSALAELQNMGLIDEADDDFCLRLESVDKYLVHGHIGTHTEIYNNFLEEKEFKNAITALTTLSDWITRQYGTIPLEVEVVCLLGIMKAQKLNGNNSAYLAYKNDIENTVISHKKGAKNLDDFLLIAQLCEDYDLNSLAKNCYFSILISHHTDIKNIIEVAFHCVTHYPSESLLLHLKKSYENHPNTAEIKSCILLCSLHLKGIKSNEYLEVKEKIRELILNKKTQTAFPFLNELSLKFNDDPEIHYYLAEMHFHKGLLDKAHFHFKAMYNLDTYNPNTSLKYIYFLLKTEDYSDAIEVIGTTLRTDFLSNEHNNELRWCLGVAYLAKQNYERARHEIAKALDDDPWNLTFITLFIRCCLAALPVQNHEEAAPLIVKMEDYFLSSDEEKERNHHAVEHALESYSSSCLQKGLSEIAWAFAKCSVIIGKGLNESTSDLLSKTGAAYLPHVAIKELLLLLKAPQNFHAPFFNISLCLAQTYALCAQWHLTDEWLTIASPQAKDTKDIASHRQLTQLRALSLAMQGKELHTAQTLVESLLVGYDDADDVPISVQTLHGYLLVAQGHIKQGLEKLQLGLSENHSLQNSYFCVKALERSNLLDSLSKEWIEHLCSFSPTNPVEQKMAEEIFQTVGFKLNAIPMGLAC